MKKASTTNKNIIFFGSLLVIVAALIIVFVSDKKEQEFTSPKNDFIPIEGAVANSYEAPQEILNFKDYDTVIGSEKADLKILVYEDYASPYSANLAETLDLLMNEYAGNLVLVSRPFISFSSSSSREAALSYLCAQEFGKANEMRELLLKQAAEEAITFNPMVCAQELKFNEDKFFACLNNQEKLMKLEKIKTEAKINSVLGAPTIFIDDEMIIGARPYADFIDSNGDAIEGLKTVIDRKL
jgi:protein-disulfide isomerase